MQDFDDDDEEDDEPKKKNAKLSSPAKNKNPGNKKQNKK